MSSTPAFPSSGGSGTPGADGAPGSVWRTGSGAPSNGTGINGDYYLRTSNGDVYFRSAGTYSVVGNIKGATGVAGATGATGAAGTNAGDILTGTAIGTAGLNDATHINDGILDDSHSVNTGNANGEWVGIDLGSAKRIYSVLIFPRTGAESRAVNGSKIQLSNSSSFASVVYEVTLSDVTVPSGRFLPIFFPQNTTPTSCRYVRFLPGTGQYCDLYEMEVYGI